MATKEQLIEKRNAAQAELERLEQELAARNALTPAQEIATQLHDSFCRGDHSYGGCSWSQETNWVHHAYSHERWLEKATRIIELSDQDAASEIIKIIREA